MSQRERRAGKKTLRYNKNENELWLAGTIAAPVDAKGQSRSMTLITKGTA